MFVCPECEGSLFSDGTAFLTHFTFFHSKNIASGSMICAHNACIGRKFNKINSFRKHVLSHKCSSNIPVSCSLGNTFTNIDNTLTVSDDVLLEPSVSESPCSIENSFSSSVQNNSVNFDSALTNSVISFIASLYDCGNLTDTQIQFIIESHMQLLGGGFLSILKGHTLSLLSKAKDAKILNADELQNTSRMFDSCQNMFEGFETHYLRMQEFEKSGAYIKPESFVIGHSQEVKTVNGHAIIEPIELTGQFAPLRHVLKGFLELPGVLYDIFNYVKYLETSWSESSPMENIIQGELWRKIIKPKFQDKCVFPLIFNFDDYETNKELGTHTCVHKLGAGYVVIPCLPPKFQSALENIFLAVLFHSGDRAFGNGRVFRKILNELKFLEETGITVVTPEGVFQIYFSLCLVTGDNLGANGILGFVESFSAKYFCRICSKESEVTKFQTEENPDKKRTPETYANDLMLDNASLTGRKGECVFNELLSFDVSENVHCDLMHDLDEGAWKYLMYFIVRYFYDKKRFTIAYLNEIIQGFYYGPNEEKNRPPTVSHDDLIKSKRLRFSASEMRCFVRYFSLMFGHLVQEEDKHVWNLYLKARKTVDIVTAPVVSCNDALVLKGLIREHHSEYMRIFNTHLVPKFHLVVHEPAMIPALGPLDLLSCYRTEHKHKEGKDVAHRSNNRINLPFTIFKRQQLRIAFRFLSGRGFKSMFKHSSIDSVPVNRIKDYPLFQNIIPDDIDREWHTVKWLQVNGAKYVIGTVVLLSLNNQGFPVFGQVRVLSVAKGNQANLVVRLLDVVRFDEHFHAFEVVLSRIWSFVHIDNLLTHVPTEIRSHANGKSYVCFRFSVACFSKLTTQN